MAYTTPSLIHRTTMKRLIALAIVALVAPILVVSQQQPAKATPGTDSVAFVDGAGQFDVWVDAVEGAGVSRLHFGDVGDVPLMGDWNCDGVDSPGVYRSSAGLVILRNEPRCTLIAAICDT